MGGTICCLDRTRVAGIEILIAAKQHGPRPKVGSRNLGRRMAPSKPLTTGHSIIVPSNLCHPRCDSPLSSFFSSPTHSTTTLDTFLLPSPAPTFHHIRHLHNSPSTQIIPFSSTAFPEPHPRHCGSASHLRL